MRLQMLAHKGWGFCICIVLQYVQRLTGVYGSVWVCSSYVKSSCSVYILYVEDRPIRPESQTPYWSIGAEYKKCHILNSIINQVSDKWDECGLRYGMYINHF